MMNFIRKLWYSPSSYVNISNFKFLPRFVFLFPFQNVRIETFPWHEVISEKIFPTEFILNNWKAVFNALKVLVAARNSFIYSWKDLQDFLHSSRKFSNSGILHSLHKHFECIARVFRNDILLVGKCGIDKKPLTFKTLWKCFRRCFFHSMLQSLWLCRKENRSYEGEKKHEEWKCSTTQLHRFPHLTLNFHEHVGVCEKEFLQFYVLCWRMSQTVTQLASQPFSDRVFLDRLLRHSTFSSCFPSHCIHNPSDTKSTDVKTFSVAKLDSENVHDYINGCFGGWMCI